MKFRMLPSCLLYLLVHKIYNDNIARSYMVNEIRLSGRNLQTNIER
jgi:hypothetical protein